ncbi:PP2C family protein-serine/threonine phosphatase [Rugosimonospora africana]|uniref:Serine/threonine phosphatase n=1 Tax=Rugosimonospora africana TaxID=556532 RepID=A0A8J3R233_9ACTN|nr:SpoIIE family protein phosphatase [Rugosimonospora africana]GIH20354.1 serine/threonine phosphatase [Rugosimonospora africana]
MNAPDIAPMSATRNTTGIWPRTAFGPDVPARRSAPPRERLRVLLIEDDAGDAFLVSELLAEADAPVDLRTATSMADAAPHLSEVDCVLLDLDLPDASGLDGLRQLLASTTGVAVCVLTGLADEPLGIAAVAEGAQDYLIKGRVDGVLLARAVRYAVERRRAEDSARRLREAELRAAEASRLERGLLPQPLIATAAVSLHTFYRPGRKGVLGGDFYDAIETGPGQLSLLVGDVSGHGVEEAALGVELRAAWRALTLAGVAGEQQLAALDRVLISARRSEEIFATVAAVEVDLTGTGRATVRLCGHPAPLLITDDRVAPVDAEPRLMLGVLPGVPRPAHGVELPERNWAVLIYTDGLIEGRVPDDPDGRLGIDGLTELVHAYRRRGGPLDGLPDWLVGQAEERNGGPLADDVAMLLLTKGSGR